MANLVFGATGMVGEFLVEHLVRRGETAIGISRSPGRSGCITADLTRPETLTFPHADTIFSAADLRTFARGIEPIVRISPKRIVAISSTNVFTKLDSKDEAEREAISRLLEAEKTVASHCESAGIEWTILRPTLVYREGRDQNVTQIASIIRRFGFMPLYGPATGLRQPVHAEDLALGAIAAAHSPATANTHYFATGLETISYREMVGRIFDGLSRRRRLISLPPILWQSAFALAKPIYPNVTAVMGERMMKDLAFDSSAATREFGWSTRSFAPSFR